MFAGEKRRKGTVDIREHDFWIANVIDARLRSRCALSATTQNGCERERDCVHTCSRRSRKINRDDSRVLVNNAVRHGYHQLTGGGRILREEIHDVDTFLER